MYMECKQIGIVLLPQVTRTSGHTKLQVWVSQNVLGILLLMKKISKFCMAIKDYLTDKG